MKNSHRLPMLVSLLLLVTSVQQSSAFYNPQTGRWLNRDPIEEQGGPSLFVSVANNPIAFIDSNGNAAQLAIGGMAKTGYGQKAPIPLKPAKTPILSFSKVGDAAASARNGGGVDWVVLWKIGNGSFNTLGGVIVQQVILDWEVKDCAGNSVASKGASSNWAKPLKYWESWPVGPISSGTLFSNDHFMWVDEGCPSKGSVTWSGKASFYHGTYESDLIDKGWTSFNAGTAAGSLLSSTSDPQLVGGSNEVDHGLSIKWDCCGKNGCCEFRKTEVIKQTPGKQ